MQELLRPVSIKLPKIKKAPVLQEELVAVTWEQMEAMWELIGDSCGTLTSLVKKALVGGVIFEDERHYRFVYEDGSCITKRQRLSGNEKRRNLFIP